MIRRIDPIDMLREYPISFIFLAAGQTFNVLMALASLVLLTRNIVWGNAAVTTPARRDANGGETGWSGASATEGVTACGAC
jgi:hypothetical protein